VTSRKKLKAGKKGWEQESHPIFAHGQKINKKSKKQIV